MVAASAFVAVTARQKFAGETAALSRVLSVHSQRAKTRKALLPSLVELIFAKSVRPAI